MRIPVLLEIANKTVIAVGGGVVAARRVPPLLDAGADITLIAPTLHPALQQLYESGQIQWQAREAYVNERFNSRLLLLMTEKEELNHALYEKKQPHQLVYLANDAQKSDLHFPAVLQKGQLTIAVSTNGASPIYAKRLRNKLAEQLPVDIEGDLDFLDQARKRIIAHPLVPKQRKQLLQQITTEEFLRQENRQNQFEKLLENLEKETSNYP